MKKESISFLLFVDGNEAYLPVWLQSIKEQDYPQTETIVVTKSPLAHLEALQKQYSFTVLLTKGASRATQHELALAKASGTFVSFLYPTCGLVKDALKLVTPCLNEHPVDAVFSRFALLEQGLFNFYKQYLGIEEVNRDNYYYYLKSNAEFRTLAGKIIRTSLAKNLDYRQSDQAILEQLVAQEATVIWNSDQFFFWNLDLKPLPEFNGEAVTLHPRVLERLSLEPSDKISDTISILLCVDDNYCQKIAPLLSSLGRTTKQQVDCYLVYYELSAASLAFVVKLGNYLSNVKLIPTKISEWQHEQLQSFSMKNNKLPLAAYYRLLAAELLPNLNRVLYLDIDMLVNSSIEALWQTELGSNVIGACRDLAFTDHKDSWSYQLLEEQGGNYFNSGLLLFNLEAMRKYKIVERFIEFIQATANVYLLGDQDAFNLFFINNTKLLPAKYNTILGYIDQSQIEQPAIIHYCGFEWLKPWRITAPVAQVKLKWLNTYRQVNRRILGQVETKPLVSLIIPQLPNDSVAAFRKCESLLMQTYPQIELIIPASEQVDYLKANAGANIQINLAAGGASLETMIASAGGEYLFFLNGPHYFKEADALTKIMELALNYRSDLVLTHYLKSIKRGKDTILLGPDESKSFLDINLLSSEDIWREHVREFSSLNGLLVNKHLVGELTKVQTVQALYQQIFNKAQAKFYLDDSLWIEVTN